MLFGLSFIMLQFCAFQMSAQAFSGGQHFVSDVSATMHEHKPQQDQNNTAHGKSSPACAVSGCVLPIPASPTLSDVKISPRLQITPLRQVLHGLPPSLSERPPKLVSA